MCSPLTMFLRCFSFFALTFFSCFLIWKREIKFFALTFATGSGISFRNFHVFFFAASARLLRSNLLSFWKNELFISFICERTSVCAWEIIQLLLPLLLYTRTLLGTDAVSPPTTSCSHDFCVHIFIYLFVCFVLFLLFLFVCVVGCSHRGMKHPSIQRLCRLSTHRDRESLMWVCVRVCVHKENFIQL